MSSLKTVLIVDDSDVSRKMLSKMLSESYTVMEAENGQRALELLEKHGGEIVAVMLDLIMPVMDGYGVLQMIREDVRYSNLPIIVITAVGGSGNEKKALELGAWDFVSKPYDHDIIMFRIKNAIDRSALPAFKQLKYMSEYDALTGIYNKSKFFDATRKMIDENSDKKFAFLRFDVDRFQLINSFFGTAEGDKLLIYIATCMAEDAKNRENATYGRIESDIVGLCLPYDQSKIEKLVKQSKKTLTKFNANYDIVPSVGIYIIDDLSISVEEMYNRATLAAKTCKGNYVDFYAYYNESMSLAILAEQEITNNMNYALENGQFEVYLQPQYNIHTNLPCGAEALVRWLHPQKGMLPPSEFIPVFERNGFITRLDYFVWERTCQYLHAWKKQGIKPYPLSVNVSRVNIYNPNIVETLLGLVYKYELDPELLNLELTESAYTDNPQAMKKVISLLQNHGFIIQMDDFGSGYSSLSVLKDIEIDVLKIDMLFLSKTDVPGRGENIIASVIRMAKWLNIPVIAEGAETLEQVDFLRSVGCDYVQGFYFARPMPLKDYDNLCNSTYLGTKISTGHNENDYCYDDLFAHNEEMKSLFGNALQAAVLYEFADDQIEMIRVNEAYYALLGHEDMLAKAPNMLSLVDESHKEALLNAFRACAATQKDIECEYVRRRTNGMPIWLYTKLSYAAMVGDKHIITGKLTDITLHKELDSELQKYRETWLSGSHNTHTVLIVDDAQINRTVLKKILQKEFLFLEAENGVEAIKILKDKQNQVDLILLDISMPVMDGKEFLKYKKNSPKLDAIPVIIITADDSEEQQTSSFTLGANDFIVKPFVPAAVIRRVRNVLEANHRFKEMVEEYNTMSAQVKTDLMTGLVNRISAQSMISQRFESTAGTCVMVIIDIDNFKKANDLHGHEYGDKIICAVADKLRVHFKKKDIIVRMGGDEFAVFISDISDADNIEKKAQQLCDDVSEIVINDKNVNITCSVGIAISDKETRTFELLYQNADKALYNAKCRGRNKVSVYGEESAAISVSKWINNAQSVLNVINDCVYACDLDSYEVIYANDNFCEFVGITLEECKGKKCYEVLMHRSSPCDFCNLSKLSEKKVYTRVFRVPNTKNIFLMRGKNVNRNGNMVHLEVAVDITDVENMNTYWD